MLAASPVLAFGPTPLSLILDNWCKSYTPELAARRIIRMQRIAVDPQQLDSIARHRMTSILTGEKLRNMDLVAPPTGGQPAPKEGFETGSGIFRCGSAGLLCRPPPFSHGLPGHSY